MSEESWECFPDQVLKENPRWRTAHACIDTSTTMRASSQEDIWWTLFANTSIIDDEIMPRKLGRHRTLHFIRNNDDTAAGTRGWRYGLNRCSNGNTNDS